MSSGEVFVAPALLHHFIHVDGESDRRILCNFPVVAATKRRECEFNVFVLDPVNVVYIPEETTLLVRAVH